jgi:hypothetical protein
MRGRRILDHFVGWGEGIRELRANLASFVARGGRRVDLLKSVHQTGRMGGFWGCLEPFLLNLNMLNMYFNK